MGRIETRLKELGIELPSPAAPVANYVAFVRSGAQVTISGQICLGSDGKIAPAHLGRVGAEVAPETAVEAARLCAVNVIAQLKAALGGDLDAVRRCVRLGGFITSAPGFTGQAGIMNGASDVMVAVFGEAGRHARSTIGVAALPLGAAVEVEALFDVAASAPGAA